MTTYVDRLLEPDELERATCRKQPAAQVRALKAMGVRFRVSPAGEPLVLLSAMHPDTQVQLRSVGDDEPDMEAFRP